MSAAAAQGGAVPLADLLLQTEVAAFEGCRGLCKIQLLEARMKRGNPPARHRWSHWLGAAAILLAAHGLAGEKSPRRIV